MVSPNIFANRIPVAPTIEGREQSVQNTSGTSITAFSSLLKLSF